MRKLLAALALLCSPYGAQAADLSVATGLVCDTAEQVESYVTDFKGDTQEALKHVNDKAGKEDACIIATLGFIKGRTLQTVRTQDEAYAVTEILVIGAVTPAGFQLVTPVKWFTAFHVDELRA